MMSAVHGAVDVALKVTYLIVRPSSRSVCTRVVTDDNNKPNAERRRWLGRFVRGLQIAGQLYK